MPAIQPHALHAEDDAGNEVIQIGWIEPAKPEDAERLLSMTDLDGDTRSEFFWLRLHDGTLLLGTFPQGDTYMQFSDGGVCGFEWEGRALVDLLKEHAKVQDTVLAVQKLMDGVEWSPDTLDEIAALLNQNGYPVRDIAD